jgi:hypothetical protein
VLPKGGGIRSEDRGWCWRRCIRSRERSLRCRRAGDSGHLVSVEMLVVEAVEDKCCGR